MLRQRRSCLIVFAILFSSSLVRASTCLDVPLTDQTARSAKRDSGAPPVVGAIRWDAWTEWGYFQQFLQPKEWHDRLPFFSKTLPDGKVEIRCDNREVMDQEIAYARQAGLDYWAFDWYHPSSVPGKKFMTRCLDLYLSSSHRMDINYASSCWREGMERRATTILAARRNGRPPPTISSSASPMPTTRRSWATGRWSISLKRRTGCPCGVPARRSAGRGKSWETNAPPEDLAGLTSRSWCLTPGPAKGFWMSSNWMPSAHTPIPAETTARNNLTPRSRRKTAGSGMPARQRGGDSSPRSMPAGTFARRSITGSPTARQTQTGSLHPRRRNLRTILKPPWTGWENTEISARRMPCFSTPGTSLTRAAGLCPQLRKARRASKHWVACLGPMGGNDGKASFPACSAPDRMLP